MDDSDEPLSQGTPEKWLANLASQVCDPPSHLPPFPMRRLWGSLREVPDFKRIPREHWAEAMRATPDALRLAAVQGVYVDHQNELVALAFSDLPPAPSDRAREAIAGSPRLAPAPPRTRTRNADRQVNFRLTPAEYEDLATAAELLGYSPSKLAAELVRHGTQRVIEEANRRGG